MNTDSIDRHKRCLDPRLCALSRSLLFAFALLFHQAALSGALDELGRNTNAIDEAIIRKAGAACRAEIDRKTERAKVTLLIMGPCKTNGKVGGVVRTAGGFAVKFLVSELYFGNSPYSLTDRIAGALRNETLGQVVVTCIADGSGQLVSISDRRKKAFFESDTDDVCAGTGQLF